MKPRWIVVLCAGLSVLMLFVGGVFGYRTAEDKALDAMPVFELPQMASETRHALLPIPKGSRFFSDGVGGTYFTGKASVAEVEAFYQEYFSCLTAVESTEMSGYGAGHKGYYDASQQIVFLMLEVHQVEDSHTSFSVAYSQYTPDGWTLVP